MTTSPFSTPLVVCAQDGAAPLSRLPLSSVGAENAFDESWLQNLVFEHPQCLPIDEIEPSFTHLVPICRELRTPVGPLDVLYCTPLGQLCVVEVKLWRNPEARRKVVGQVLDYATELSRWSYGDLQREVSRVTGRSGNALYDLVAARHPEVEEARFVDRVTKALAEGDFLLLVVGDGIREGVGRIASYLGGHTSLAFTFGLVELAVYDMAPGRVLVQPRVLASTVIVQRTVVRLSSPGLEIEDEGDDSDGGVKERPLTDLEKFYGAFWPEFLSALVLDDVDQELARPHPRGMITFGLPPSAGQAWITVYFLQQSRTVGVFFRLKRGDFGDLAYDRLSSQSAEIDEELAVPVEWHSEDGQHRVEASRTFDDLRADRNREEIKAFLADRVNRFVNVFRPRMKRIVEETA